MEILNYVLINVFTIVFCVISMFFFKLEREMKQKIKLIRNDMDDKEETTKETRADSKDSGTEVNADNEDESVEDNKSGNIEEDIDDLSQPYSVINSVGLGFIMLMFVMNIALGNLLTYIYDNSVVVDIKLMFVVCMLWPIAFIDYRTKMIPNYILKVMLVLRVVFLVPEFIMLGDIPHRLISMAVATAAVFIACVLCCLLIKGAIGMGDVKLFSIMALFLGLEGIWPAIFCSLIVSFFISIFSLVTKRVKRKDNIPFAPAILIGTYLSVFLTGI